VRPSSRTLQIIRKEHRLDTNDMVFRSQTLNHDIDQAILALAVRLCTPAGAVFRLLLEAGLAQLKQGMPLPEKVEEASLVLRTVHIRVDSDFALEAISVRRGIERWELVARVLRLGLAALSPSMPVGQWSV
jgi:hypothetical protein